MNAGTLEQIQKRIQELERRAECAAAPKKAIIHPPHRRVIRSKDKKEALEKANKVVKIEVKNEVKTEGKVKTESAKVSTLPPTLPPRHEAFRSTDNTRRQTTTKLGQPRLRSIAIRRFYPR